MDCPECGKKAQLLMGGYFTHVTGYACNNCGMISDIGGRRHTGREPTESPNEKGNNTAGILTRVETCFARR